MILHAYQQNGSAEIAYRRAHLLDGKSFAWIYYLALVQEAQGKKADSIESLRTAVQIRPDYTPARLRLAEQLLDTGDFAGSERLYQQLVSDHPNLAVAHYGIGRAKSARGDPAGAIHAWRRACDIYPEYGSAHHALAVAYRRAGHTVDAELHEAAHSRSPSAAPPRADTLESDVMALNEGAQAHLKRGVDLAAAGRLEEAVRAHERALEIDSTLLRAHVNLISLYGRQAQPNLAETHYRKAVAINAHDAEAHYNYGVVLLGIRRVTEAKAAFQQALEANPRHAEAHNNLGYLLMEDGALDAAERHFIQALKNQPDHRLARFHLGRLLVHRKDYAAAIRHFTRILEPEDERTPGFAYALAATYARAGQRDKALEYARMARRKAAALNQSDLLASIDKVINHLEHRR
jgi:tetratricopeptide (TPR) repeat protein